MFARCIVNTPHNPTGRAFDAEELDVVAEFCVKYDAVCLSDEVYEACIYPKSESESSPKSENPVGHLSISSFDGMKERTLLIGSSSKLLGVTGWRVGWVVAPAPLIKAVSTIHSYVRCAAY